MAGAHLADHVERPVGEVVGEVVVVGVLVDLDDVVVLVETVRLVEVREPVEDPVEAVETLLAGPAVARAGLGEVGVLAEVPLADHERGPTGITQDLAHRDGVVADLHGVAGEPGVAVADGGEAGEVVVEAGQQ